jgi:transposase-like protein
MGREEQRRSTSPNTHVTVKDKASERSDTQKNTSAPTTCRVPRPRCTKCTKTFLKFSMVVTVRTKEMQRSIRYKHTRVQHDNQKMGKDTRFTLL